MNPYPSLSNSHTATLQPLVSPHWLGVDSDSCRTYFNYSSQSYKFVTLLRFEPWTLHEFNLESSSFHLSHRINSCKCLCMYFQRSHLNLDGRPLTQCDGTKAKHRKTRKNYGTTFSRQTPHCQHIYMWLFTGVIKPRPLTQSTWKPPKSYDTKHSCQFIL